MNKYEFYSTILQEDFPVKYREVIADNDSEKRKEIRELREALARVEAERDGWKEQRDILADYCQRADDRVRTAQAQLAEALGLLEKLVAYYSVTNPPNVLLKARAFLTRHAQRVQQEAQRVQVGDEKN